MGVVVSVVAILARGMDGDISRAAVALDQLAGEVVRQLLPLGG